MKYVLLVAIAFFLSSFSPVGATVELVEAFPGLTFTGPTDTRTAA